MIPKPDEIRAARERTGLTQTQAAELLGFQRDAWAKYEGGKTDMIPALWAYWLHVAGIKRIPFSKRKRADTCGPKSSYRGGKRQSA